MARNRTFPSGIKAGNSQGGKPTRHSIRFILPAGSFSHIIKNVLSTSINTVWYSALTFTVPDESSDWETSPMFGATVLCSVVLFCVGAAVVELVCASCFGVLVVLVWLFVVVCIGKV